MAIEGLHPALVFLVGAVAVALTRGPLRALLAVATPVVSFLAFLGLPDGDSFLQPLIGLDLILARIDRMSWLFGLLFHIAALLAIIYSLHIRNRLEQVSSLLYAGSAIGAVLAGDFLSLFIFWELLALTSTFIVWSNRQAGANACGLRYLAFQVLSGVLLLAGILIHYHGGGSLEMGAIDLASPGAMLMLLGFGVKAGFPLFHVWLIDAYPRASATGTVFLCAFTTKTAVYALARVFAGTEELITIGAVMTVFPIFFAIIENDLRKVLSYSMINQIGFMVVGIGIGSELAIDGALAHAFNDVLFKGLLFMAMGAVLHVTSKSCATDLGGLWKKMPWTTALCLIGALSISAVPLFGAFVSKAMILAAAIEEGPSWLWFVLLFASAGVLEHAGIKIPFFAFFAEDRKLAAHEPPLNMRLAMVLAAFLCLLIGCRPDLLLTLLPGGGNFDPYTTTHVLTQLQLLIFASLAVMVLMRSGIYPLEMRALNIEAEWIYRKGWRWFHILVVNPVERLFAAARSLILEEIPAHLARSAPIHRFFTETIPVNWRLSTPVLLAVLFLLLYLLLNLR